MLRAFGLFALAAVPLYHLLITRRRASRPQKILAKGERVLVVGASSGIGRSIAIQYARRGAQVVIVGRRESLLDEVKQACEEAGAVKAIRIAADFGDAADMVRVREVISRELSGLDTLVVAAGVSALQPLISGVAGAQRPMKDEPITGDYNQPSFEGIQRAKDVATLAIQGNFIGPLVTATTFIPLLEASSASPSILLISSVASVIPAPTRSLYASTKGASLLLYQSLSIEHPRIAFSHVLPGTVEGDFRASAVDGGDVREVLSGALKKEDTAEACIRAVDAGTKVVFLPAVYRLAHAVYWLFPAFVERGARKKYNFEA